MSNSSVRLRPEDITVDELVESLTVVVDVFKAADDVRPLASHVHALIRAAYYAGKEDGREEGTTRLELPSAEP